MQITGKGIYHQVPSNCNRKPFIKSKLEFRFCFYLCLFLLTTQVACGINKEGKLFKAASLGDVKTVEELLNSGINVNARESEDETPLMHAAAEGHSEIVALLLRRGADIYARSANGQTALGRAAIYGHAHTVEILLKSGANVEESVDQKGTPLMAALNLETAKVLLLYGADPNAKDEFGRTSLMLAAADGKTDIVKELLEHRSEINQRDNDKKTALSWAKERNQLECVHLLKLAGAIE